MTCDEKLSTSGAADHIRWGENACLLCRLDRLRFGSDRSRVCSDVYCADTNNCWVACGAIAGCASQHGAELGGTVARPMDPDADRGRLRAIRFKYPFERNGPMAGPGFHFHPAILADYNTGIHDTQFYGNIDSTVYPTLNYTNNTFNQQAGVIEKYSPLPDLLFTVHGDYTHNTNTYVLQNSIPAPVTSPGTPPPPGAGGVIAIQQTVFNPNDTYTGTGTIYKQFSLGSVTVGGTLQTTQYSQNPSQNYNTSSYNGSGNFYFTPAFYVFSDGIQSFQNPATGPSSNYFRARAGVGSAQIGLFSGFIYYGQQGSSVNGDGSAGGDLYGGGINYFPTAVWNMSFSVDRLKNVSNITVGNTICFGLGCRSFRSGFRRQLR